jgi:glycosyltransferase involved in cell wall biosynthesis
MKIALLSPITHTLPPQKYAPWEKVLYTLASGLQKAGNDVTVFAAADSSAEFPMHATVAKSLTNLTDFKFQQELIHISQATKAIKQGNFDIVHNHLNWYGLLFLDTIGIPYVTTLHGMEPEGKYVYSQYKKNKFVSISVKLREMAPDLNYIANVYNGVDFDFFKPQPKTENYLFIGGRICHDKGVHNAIKLAKETGLKLIIAGTIDNQQYFDKEVKPFLKSGQVDYVGNVSQSQFRDYAAKALAYVSLIEWEEPFGLSVAETIACGTPVITTRRGSMPELIKDGINGILVDTVAEAVERIKEIQFIDPIKCRLHGANLFSVEKMVAGYLEAYEKAMQET